MPQQHKNASTLGLFNQPNYLIVGFGSAIGILGFIAFDQVKQVDFWLVTALFATGFLIGGYGLSQSVRDLFHGTVALRGQITDKVDDTGSLWDRDRRYLSLGTKQFDVGRGVFSAIDIGDEIEIVYWPRTRVVRSITVLATADGAAS